MPSERRFLCSHLGFGMVEMGFQGKYSTFGDRRKLLIQKAPSSTKPRFGLRPPRGAFRSGANSRSPLVNGNAERESARRFAFIPNGAKSLDETEADGRALCFVTGRTGSEPKRDVSVRASDETGQHSRALW